MKQVLHVVDHNGPGGVQVLLNQVLKCSDKALMHNVLSLRDDDITVIENHADLQVVKGKSVQIIKAFFALREALKQMRPQVVVLHLPLAQVLGLLLRPFFSQVQFVWYEHGEILQSNLRGVVLRWAFRLLGLRWSGVVVISNFLGQRISKLGFKRYFLLYNPWPQSANTAMKKSEVPPQVIGFAGRICNRKRWQWVLQAAVRFPQLQFIIAGDGPQLSILKTQAAGINNVQVWGYIAHMEAFWQAIDMLLIPSVWEGHALVKLEAVHHGITVMAFNGPGLNEPPHQGVAYFDSFDELCNLLASPPTLVKGEKNDEEIPDFKLWLHHLETYLAQR